MLTIDARMEFNYLKSIRNVHGIGGKRIYFSNTKLADVAIFRTTPPIKFIMKANIGGVHEKSLTKIQNKLLEMAKDLDSTELLLDVSKVNDLDKIIVYDMANKRRMHFFSAYPPATLNADVLVVIQEEKEGKLSEEELYILATDADCLPTLASFQNTNSMFSRGGYSLTKYGSETGFKLFAKLNGFKYKIHTYCDIDDFCKLGKPSMESLISDEYKNELLSIFSEKNNLALQEEIIKSGNGVLVDDILEYSLVDIVSYGVIPIHPESVPVAMDLDIGLDVKEAFVKTGWLHFIIEDRDGEFWEEYNKNKEELCETLGGLMKITIIKYGTEGF